MRDIMKVCRHFAQLANNRHFMWKEFAFCFPMLTDCVHAEFNLISLRCEQFDSSEVCIVQIISFSYCFQKLAPKVLPTNWCGECVSSKGRVRAMKRSVLMALALALAVSPSVYGGQVLNVEFGPPGIDYSGLGAAPDTGTVWNYAVVPGTTYYNLTGAILDISNLRYSDGTAASGITITSSTSVASWIEGPGLLGSRIYTQHGPNENPSNPNGGPRSGYGYPFSLTISGLNPNQTYDLYCYGSNPGYATTYTVGTTSDYAYGYSGEFPFTQHINYGLLTGLTPTNGNGTLVINLTTYGSSTLPDISALQLLPEPSVSRIPEPASLTLLGIGAVGLLGYAWGRRKQPA